MRLTKAQRIELCKRAGIEPTEDNLRDCLNYFSEVVELIKSSLVKGEDITIDNFGRFQYKTSTRNKTFGKVHDPKTTHRVDFKESTNFKKRLNS